MTALAALAAAAIAPPEGAAIPPALEPVIREACAGAWRAIEIVLAGDVLRGRLSKTRDSIVHDGVEAILELFGNVGLRAEALASLRAARDAGALDGEIDVAAVIADVRLQGPVAVGRAAVTVIRKQLAAYRALELVLADGELGTLLVDSARAIFRTRARDPELARFAIGPTGSPGRDRALSAFSELAISPDSLAELEILIALPIHLDDNVQFTVYRPRAIDPGRWHQLLAFAHLAERRPGEDELPDPVEEVQRQAAAVLGDKAKQYSPIVQDAGAAIPAEGELTFVPEFPGIEVNPPRRSFLWLESVHREEFRIRAGRQLDGQTVRGRVTVYLGHIAIAEVACAVRVDASRPEPKREPTSVRAYRKIFASYSHRDLDVVNQFETYARALGDEYLRDWVHLRTGEVWTDRLCQLIEQADAFQLFWSKNSMHSQFVRQEYEYALSLNRASFVRPTYWEEPMPTAPGLPPEALLRLHFQKLGAGTLAAGRMDTASEAKLIARKKRAEPELAVDREIESGDTNAWAARAEIDVTDPQYSLPEMPAADASSSMPAAPPLPERMRRETVATTPPPMQKKVGGTMVPDLDEEAASEIGDVTDRIEPERMRSRSVTTEPGIGAVKHEVAAKASVDPEPISAKTLTTAPGVEPARPRAASRSASLIPPAPAIPRPASLSQPPPIARPPSIEPSTPPSPPPSRPSARPAPAQPVAMPSPAAPAMPLAPPAMPAFPASPPSPVIDAALTPVPEPVSESQPGPPSPFAPSMSYPASSPEPVQSVRPISPIPTTTPGVAPPPGLAPPEAVPSPWSRPGPMKTMMTGSAPVSPYAPTMPQQVYQPKPGDPLYQVDEPKAMAAPEARPSRLPYVLITIGVLALLAVFLIWLFS